VEGLNDVTLLPNISTAMSFNVQYVGPIQEHVALSLQGLPNGITIDTTQAILSGIPTFYSQIPMINTGVIPGIYHAKLICNGSVTGQKSYDFDIHVLSCAEELSGPYSRCGSVCGSVNSFADNVKADPSSTSRVYFSNFGGKRVSVYADISCDNGSITIPSQSAGGETYLGSGSFSSGYLMISYQVDSAGYTNYCNFSMSR